MQQGAGRDWPTPSLNKGEEVRRFSFVSDKGKELAKHITTVRRAQSHSSGIKKHTCMDAEGQKE